MRSPRSFPITGVHQIELTSRCNLACKYCPHGARTMDRLKVDMTAEILGHALRWLFHFVKAGTQGVEVNVAGIGESTLVPDMVEKLGLVREVMGPDRVLVLTTNGLLVTEEMVEGLLKLQPIYTYVSLHRPEKARKAVSLLHKAGILRGAAVDAAIAPINWAGQVEWDVATNTESSPCPWLQEKRVMIAADGQVLTCCLDASGEGAVGNVVTDNPEEIRTQPYSLCATCHHTTPGYYGK